MKQWNCLVNKLEYLDMLQKYWSSCCCWGKNCYFVHSLVLLFLTVSFCGWNENWISNPVLKKLKTISRPILSVSHCCCSKLAVDCKFNDFKTIQMHYLMCCRSEAYRVLSELHFFWVHAQSVSHILLWTLWLLSPWYFWGKNTGVDAISFFRGSFRPKDQNHISCGSCIGRQILYHWATPRRKTKLFLSLPVSKLCLPLTCKPVVGIFHPSLTTTLDLLHFPYKDP